MFKEMSMVILDEIKNSLLQVDPDEVQKLITRLQKSDNIFCLGAGRSKTLLKSFCIRLNQLGLNCYEVGGVPCPPITKDDLLIVVTGSGSTQSVLAIMQRAKEFGATISVFTASPPDNISLLSDNVISIQAPSTLLPKEENSSKQLMRALFEQVTFIIQETIIAILSLGIPIEEIVRRHANLE